MTYTFNTILAVDGGQSSTLAVVAAPTGRILGTGLAGPSNHVHEPGGLERLTNALHRSIGQALTEAACAPEQVSHICLGMTGAVDEAREIVTLMFPAAAIQVYYDMVTALAGASLARPGVVVIAGTGSIAYGRLEDGREARAGGWGYLIGDEGSAYQIGRAALQAASRAVDKRDGPTLLAESIPNHFQLSTMREVRDLVYTSAVTRPKIAGLATVVAQAARQGDATAQSLLEFAGRALAEISLAVMAQLNTLETGMEVFTTGGVFQAKSFILEPLRKAVHARSPASTVQLAIFSPIIGALFLALRSSGIDLESSIIDSIRSTLPESAVSKHGGQEEQ